MPSRSLKWRVLAETAAILESAASFLKLGAKKLWLAYDEEVDVLYVSFRRPQKAPGSRMEGDLIYHHRDKELVGVTILHASEINQQEETGSEVTIPKEIQPQTLNMQRCISKIFAETPRSRFRHYFNKRGSNENGCGRPAFNRA